MDIEDIKKNISKKLVVTILVVVMTYLLARASEMDAHVSLVFASAIGSYNYMQGRIDEKKNED